MTKFASCLEPFDTSVLEGMERLLQARLERTRLDNDYAFFAGEILRIRTKSGAIEPLVFNRAQQYIHDKLEAQLWQSRPCSGAHPERSAAGLLDLHRGALLPPRQ